MQNLKTAKLGLALATTALLLSACGGTETPPQPTEQAGTILGQVQPMKSTTKTVFPVNGAVETPGTPFTANVQNNGNFDLTLPNTSTLNTRYASDLKTVKASYAYCDGTLNPGSSFTTNAPPEMKMLQINELRSNDSRSLLSISNSGTTFRQWWYVDRDLQLTFSGTDCLFLGDVNANLALKKGWNVVEMTSTPKANDKVVTTFKVIPQPTTRTVYSDEGLAALSLKGFNINMLRPWQNPANFK